MSAEQIETQLMALPVEERRKFIEWMDEHRDQLEDNPAIANAQRGEMLARLQEMDSDPAMRIPFGEAEAKQMFKDIADARAQKTSAGIR